MYDSLSRSISIVDKPDVLYSEKNLDFGDDFYVTVYEEQARKWAIRKAMRQGNQSAIINVYDLKDNWDDFRVLSFKKENEQWIDFVCSCRRDKTNVEYDIVKGSVADDDVFKAVSMYFEGFWDKARVIDELKYYKSSNQICIANQETLDKIIEFKNAYEVKNNGR